MSKEQKSWNIAIVGVTGAVGKEMMNVLLERQFPVNNLRFFASEKSLGKEINFEDKKIKVEILEKDKLENIDIALFAAGKRISEKWCPIFAEKGCVVIDNSSFFRMDDSVPLIVPEVNADQIELFKNKNIIANPNCSTAQLVVALKPLSDLAKIKRVIVSTYQSVSGAGHAGEEELSSQVQKLFNEFNKHLSGETFTKQIAFNVIPHIDKFMEDGYTGEEWKMAAETKKILSADIKLTATCVRVPVFVGHSESVNIEFDKSVSVEDARKILGEAPGCVVLDKREDGGYTTPIECVGNYATFISRIRKDNTIENGLSIWVVSDNLRKGAALNAVQIAEILINKFLTKKI